MSPFIWLKNKVRNYSKGSMLGRLLMQNSSQNHLQILRLVSATRMTEKEFWRSSALGRSLKIWKSNSALHIDVHYENKEGLPKIYNAYIRNAKPNEALLFIHDDIWLDDPEWLAKTLIALDRFDIVGVAGNTQISPSQPAWCFKSMENDRFTPFSTAVLSGAVGHGPLPNGQISFFGPSPAACRLLDGLFLAVRGTVARESKAFFDDERFNFHFYDLDYCRTTHQRGLSLGTWPISLTHQSTGAFASKGWRDSYAVYLAKWKS